LPRCLAVTLPSTNTTILFLPFSLWRLLARGAQAISVLGLKLSSDSLMELQALFDSVASRDCPRCPATVSYTEWVKLVTPAVLGCGNEEQTRKDRVMDNRKDLGWAPSSPTDAAARGAARAAISAPKRGADVKVVKVAVNSKDTIETVVRLEAKQAALERMLKKEQGIAAAATTAAAKSAAAAEREATRNQIQDYLSRFDDSAAFDRDVADVEPAARVACKQKGVSMRIAARQAAHSLTSIGEEMRQDEEEDKREEVHATAISEAPGSVQQLISASRKVVQKERAAILKVQATLAAFDPPDCLAPPPPPPPAPPPPAPVQIQWNYKGMQDMISHAVGQVQQAAECAVTPCCQHAHPAYLPVPVTRCSCRCLHVLSPHVPAHEGSAHDQRAQHMRGGHMRPRLHHSLLTLCPQALTHAT